MTGLAAQPRPLTVPSPTADAKGPGAVVGRTPRAAQAMVAASALAVGVLATWNSVHKSMWMDEWYSRYTATLPFLQTVHRSLRFELQPPLYFALLNLWLRMEQSVVFGRLLSTVAVMGLVIVIAGIARRLGLRGWSLIALGAAAVPSVIWAAAELRGYALTMLAATLTWYFFVGLTRTDREPARSDVVGYTLAAAALLMCFYYGAFVLFGQWVAAGITRRRWGRITALLAISSITLLPLIPTIRWQAGVEPDRFAHLDLIAEPGLALWTTARTFVDGIGANAPILGQPHATAIAVAVLLLVPLARLLGWRRPRSSDEVLAVVAAVVPVACLGALRLFNISLVLPRYTLVALPGVMVVTALWIYAIGPVAFRVAVGAVVVGALIANLVNFERSGLQQEDWRAAANYVAAHASDGDVVLVYDPDRSLPFGYYYHGSAPVFGLPTDVQLNAYAPNLYVVHDTAQVAARVAAVGADRKGVWFVTKARLALYGPPLTTAYLRAHRRLDPPISFDGVWAEYAHAP